MTRKQALILLMGLIMGLEKQDDINYGRNLEGLEKQDKSYGIARLDFDLQFP